MIWKDRKYINPRKRVFKNMDTNDILNLELQDDEENIEEESETPLNAHNLNLAQQDLLDDMSKTYVGTSITAPTVEGYGRINKLYGYTIEEGTGEKSPSNPYTLRCVADDVNLFDEKFRLGGSGQVVTDGTAVNRLYNVQNLYLEAGKTYAFSTDLDIATYRWAISIFPNQLPATVAGTYDSGWKQQKEFSFTPSQSGYFGIGLSRADNANLTVSNISQYHFKLQKGSIATPYSPYGKGTVEIISKNGDQQSSNVVLTKPLCCLKDGDNIIAQDYIDYNKGVVHRECGYISSYNNETISTQYISSTGSLTAGATIVYKLTAPIEEPIDCSNKIVQYGEQTTVSNRDGAKIEVALTNNEAISGLNEELGRIQEKTLKTLFDFRNYVSSGIDVNDSSIFKANNIITLMLNISKTDGFEANTSHTIATLPASIKPSRTIVAPCVFHTGGQAIEAGYIVINTNGEVKITTSTKKYACMCNLTYNID